MPKAQRNLLAVLLVCLVVGAAMASARVEAAERRVALVIGNGAYESAPLRNPVNDARAVAKSLNQVGFEVMLRTNLDLQGMVEAVRELGAKLKEGDVAVFYYSGHGMQVKGRNFLIPVRADIRGEDEVPYLSLDVSQLLDKLEFARSRVNVVILDACRNNPYVRTFRSARVGLAQMDAPGGTLIAFATAPGSEARDGDAEYGTYTRHLLAHLTTPGLPIEIMFRRVREGVTAETKDRQTPWESSSLKGDFYFNPGAPKPAAVAAPAAAQPAEPLAVELSFWDSIKTSNNPADFQEYLNQYPNGRFAGLARNRLRAAQPEIVAAAKPPPAPPAATTSADVERERAEMVRALDEERHNREREADAVKLEMERLRAELLRLKETPAAAAPAPAPKPATAATPRPQVARAPPTAPTAAGQQAFAAEWAARIALLEKARGQLTLSKATAILLDITGSEGLSLLVALDQEIKSRAWQIAHAIGVDRRGRLVWGGGYGWRLPTYAVDTAREYCARTEGDQCRVVVLNGEFREQDFLAVARGLGGQSVASVREAYLATLRASPVVTQLQSDPGGGAQQRNSFAYSSVREAGDAAARRQAGAAPGVHAGEWAPRIAELEKSRGKLTLVRAISLLLDLGGGDGVALVTDFERRMIRERPWQNAFALGVDRQGGLIWGGGYGWRLPAHATDTAREYCARSEGDECRIVIANGDFREAEFIEVAKLLGEQGVAAVRDAFFAGLRREPMQIQLQSDPGGGASRGNAYAYALSREAAPREPAAARAPGPYAAEWAARIELLAKAREPVTLSRALAILLDLGSGNGQGLVVDYERELKSQNWQSAFALGVDRNGRLVWGGSYGWTRQQYAADAALEYCAKSPGDVCKVVVTNGEFHTNAFVEAVKPLGQQSVSAVREAGVQSLRNKPPVFVASPSGGGGTGNTAPTPSWGFTSLRE